MILIGKLCIICINTNSKRGNPNTTTPGNEKNVGSTSPHKTYRVKSESIKTSPTSRKENNTLKPKNDSDEIINISEINRIYQETTTDVFKLAKNIIALTLNKALSPANSLIVKEYICLLVLFHY